MRTDPEPSGTERQQLQQFLQLHRETLLLKAEGLSQEQLSRAHPPSTLTIAGLLNHLALVEDWWFAVQYLGLEEREPWASVDWEADPDWEFHEASTMDPDALRERYREACARNTELVAGIDDLDKPSARTSRTGANWNLRWVLLHMIEETARHVGHADLIREAIDGSTGE